MVEHFVWHQAFGHARASDRAEGIDADVIFCAFDFQRVHDAHNAELAAAIIGLAEIAVEAGGGGGDNDAAIALFFHNVPDRFDRLECAAQVNVEHEVDVGIGHFGEGFVAQDARIADENVDPAKGGHCVVDHFLDAGFVVYR